MKHLGICILICLMAGTANAGGISKERENAATPRFQTVAAAVYNYVGNIGGAPAYARVSFEQLRGYVVMSGQIRSNQFAYSFIAEIVGNSGYGDMLDHSQGTRFRIKIDLAPNGFALTSNPFGPGTPTTYYFKRQ